VNGGAFAAASGPVSFRLEGRHTLPYRSGDGRNREADRTVVLPLDWTPPATAGTVTAPFEVNGIALDKATFDVTATDNLSGVDSVLHSCSGASWLSNTGASDHFVVYGNGATSRRYYAQVSQAISSPCATAVR
jgi:hypothetical protein